VLALYAQPAVPEGGVTSFLSMGNWCPACWSSIAWQQSHVCPEYRNAAPRAELTDDEVDRIARRVVELMKTGKRAAEQ
jgi:hypothetical protein